MKFYKILPFIYLFFAAALHAQDTIAAKPLSKYDPSTLQTDEYGQKYYYDTRQKAKIYEINGENVIVMDELVMKKGPRFNNQLDRNYYYFLNKKLERVYPLFLTALQQYRDIQIELKNVKKESQRGFVKKKQEVLATEYEAKLRNLTTTEGRVFAKLMHRSTGKPVFEIIKELRGGWSAFWWNVKGNIADVDIKQPYDPHTNRSDLFLESLLQYNWNNGYLMPYKGAENFKITK